ncbi:MAG: hypothetical protein LDLANPLL_02405 [Turneriella sp.]|nr:hypothetical protein [Turneriella sp.]
MRKFWDSLSSRERTYLIILGIFAVLIALFLSARSFANYMSSLSERSQNAESNTSRLESLGREFQMLQAMRTGESQQLDNMLSTIETMLKTIGLREKVGSLTPTDTVVQDKYVKREVKVTIKESPANLVLDFIRQIEQNTQTLYKVESFNFRPVLKKTGVYDFNISISGFEKKNDKK